MRQFHELRNNVQGLTCHMETLCSSVGADMQTLLDENSRNAKWSLVEHALARSNPYHATAHSLCRQCWKGCCSGPARKGSLRDRVCSMLSSLPLTPVIVPEEEVLVTWLVYTEASITELASLEPRLSRIDSWPDALGLRLRWRQSKSSRMVIIKKDDTSRELWSHVEHQLEVVCSQVCQGPERGRTYYV